MPRPTSFVSRGGIFIPMERLEPLWKIEIIDDNSTTHTVLNTSSGAASVNKTLSASFTKTATNSLGSFRLTISNLNGEFLRKFNGGEVVNIYFDFTDATTLRFRGKIDNVRYGLNISEGWVVNIDGRDYPELADDVTIIQFSNKNAVNCLRGNTGDNQDSEGNWDDGVLYNTGITWSDLNTVTAGTITTTITQSYQNKSYWEIIKDVCERANLDCYLYYDTTASKWKIRVFAENSITNDDEYISYGVNLSTVGEFGYDNNFVKNKIIAYGKEDDNVIRLTTRENTTSQNNLWKKAEVLTDSNMTTVTQLRQYADSILSQKAISEQTGRLTSLVLMALNPGEKIRCTVPYCDIDGYFKVQSFTTDFSASGSFTSVNLTRNTINISDIFQDALDIEGNVTGYKNLNNMTNSLNFDFDDVTDSLLILTNCGTDDGILRLSTGQTTGTCVSRIVSTVTEGQATANVTKCELRIKANFYKNCTFRVSNNDGNSWESVTPGVLHTFTSTGNALRIEITLNVIEGVSPEFEAITLLYK